MLRAAIGIVLLVYVGLANVKFTHCRSIESECRTNLRGAARSERYYFEAEGVYAMDAVQLERGNRYTYFLGGGAEIPGQREPRVPASRIPTSFAGGVPLGISDCTSTSRLDDRCQIVMACAREKPDGTLDIWSVSTRDRETKSGELIRAEQPYHETPPPEPPPWRWF